MSEPDQRVAGVLVALRMGETVTRAQIREVGQVAHSLGLHRRKKEPYDAFLLRIIQEPDEEQENV